MSPEDLKTLSNEDLDAAEIKHEQIWGAICQEKQRRANLARFAGLTIGYCSLEEQRKRGSVYMCKVIGFDEVNYPITLVMRVRNRGQMEIDTGCTYQDPKNGREITAEKFERLWMKYAKTAFLLIQTTTAPKVVVKTAPTKSEEGPPHEPKETDVIYRVRRQYP